MDHRSLPTEELTLNLRAVVRLLGAFLAIVATGLIASRLLALLDEVAPLLTSWVVVAVTAAASLAYGFSLFLLGLGWSVLVQPAPTDQQVSMRHLVAAYGTASIGKYLPGNIFHFAGRQVLGGRLGLRQTQLAIGSVLEATICVLSALGLAVLLLGLARPAATIAFGDVATLVVLLAFIVLAPLVWLSMKRFAREPGSLSVTLPGGRRLATAGLLATVFFALNALAAVVVFGALADSLRFAVIIAAAYLLSWVAGFVVPGAPGGIGIREATLLALLGPMVAEEQVIALGLVMRAVTTLGDVFFAGICFGAVARPVGGPLGKERIDHR